MKILVRKKEDLFLINHYLYIDMISEYDTFKANIALRITFEDNFYSISVERSWNPFAGQIIDLWKTISLFTVNP